MPKRQGSNRNNIKSHKIPELEIQTAAWYLPGNPINTDAYPWVYIHEPHDLIELKTLAKTPGGTNFSCSLEQAIPDISGSIAGFASRAVDGSKFGNNSISVIKVQSDGKILVGGSFNNYAGTSGRGRLVRLNSDGTLDTTFTANASDGNKFGLVVSSIDVQSDGKILVGGNFNNYAGLSGISHFIRLNSDGTLDTTFTANASSGDKFNATVNSFKLQSDGKIVVGGNFTNYAGTTGRSHFIRLNSDGTLDTTFTANASDGNKFNSLIFTVSVQLDDKILVGGDFTNYAGTTGRSHFIRLNSDGTLDTTFTANASDGNKFGGVVWVSAAQLDGKVLVGGGFTNYAGTTNRNRLVRLNSDGTLDTTFTANASDGNKFNSIVNEIGIQSDGKILVGGVFFNYAGTTGRDRLVRLNSDGTLDNDTFVIKGTANLNSSTYIQASNVSQLNQAAGAVYRLVPTAVPTAIRDITISLVYRKNLVSE